MASESSSSRKRKQPTPDPDNSEVACLERKAQLTKARAEKAAAAAKVAPAAKGSKPTKPPNKASNMTKAAASQKALPKKTTASLQPASSRFSSPCIEEVEDEEARRPLRPAPRKPTSVIELDQDSDQDDNDDDEEMPGMEPVSDDDEEDEEDKDDWDDEPESAQEEIVYVFFDQHPTIEEINGRRIHAFQCNATQCLGKTRGVRRYLDTKDAKSTGNMRKHAKVCWGDEAVAAADGTGSAINARAALEKMRKKDGSITAAFERSATSKITFSHCQHTTIESRYVCSAMCLNMLRALANAVKNSTTLLLPAWHAMLKKMGYSIRNMPRDVATRWNSTYDMLLFIIQHRNPINAMTADRSLNLRKYELDDEEWEIAGKLKDTLKIFKDATLYFSRGNTPSLSAVIPAMDHIDTSLATTIKDLSNPTSIRAALGVGKKMLNKYYNKTDHSEVYRIAMVLHPRHKLQYFKSAGWEEGWVDAAAEIVREEYDRSYALIDVPICVNGAPAAKSVNSDNIFDSLPDLSEATSDAVDELEDYLSSKTEKVTDPCAWWHSMRTTYPRLSRMALDYHTIPATSVDVERVFSQGRILLSHLRSCLSVQLTRALMCLGEWSKHGYVKDNDILSVLKTYPPLSSGEKEEPLAADWDHIDI
ncbi:hypothetical protein D9619_009657 [Psilocybe cf. subviscida]|uniref:HAT C-terminal dimerisation domain-containing protein n=1 Tax=Psilocybe cf. subviscida TaxID=2480587 RepID=A0A8H5F6A5_9AGAR|nr:hypothetical protein D9619_009657 [Psilocybe cf. subviscida]